jgi:hypothetical protein
MDTMVHVNLQYRETGGPMPRDKASPKKWSRYGAESNTVLEQELFPISVTGQYTDVLIKDNGRWQFIAWTGGEIPKKH